MLKVPRVLCLSVLARQRGGVPLFFAIMPLPARRVSAYHVICSATVAAPTCVRGHPLQKFVDRALLYQASRFVALCEQGHLYKELRCGEDPAYQAMTFLPSSDFHCPHSEVVLTPSGAVLANLGLDCNCPFSIPQCDGSVHPECPADHLADVV